MKRKTFVLLPDSPTMQRADDLTDLEGSPILVAVDGDLPPKAVGQALRNLGDAFFAQWHRERRAR